jgi:hypothetical protein
VSEDALARQLAATVRSRLLDPLEILLGDVGGLGGRVDAAARGWAETLSGDDHDAARFLAIRLVAALYSGDRPFDPAADWWLTPFGRIVALRAGHPSAQAVSYAAAGAMLGITRQGVYDLVRRGKLERHRRGGVATESISERLQRTSVQ